jgi:hypothetical protein
MHRKFDMKKIISYNLAVLIVFSLVSMATYYVLLQENFLHMSISSIIKQSHHLRLNQHLLVLGILPIYIAMVIFGAAILGVYLNGLIQEYLFYVYKKHIVKTSS